jgi:hypothetical protein
MTVALHSREIALNRFRASEPLQWCCYRAPPAAIRNRAQKQIRSAKSFLALRTLLLEFLPRRPPKPRRSLSRCSHTANAVRSAVPPRER